MYETDRMYAPTREMDKIIARMALEAGFSEVVEADVPLLGVSSPMYNAKGKWSFGLNKDTLYVCHDRSRLARLYERSHDLARMVIEYALEHERQGHLEGYSVDKIKKKQADIEIERYGIEKFYSMCERDQKRFVKEVIKSGSSKRQQESQANVQAVMNQLESGVDRERLMEKIAASIWYARGWDRSILHGGRDEKLKDDVRGYLEWHFPWLKTKDDVVDKALDIDRKFQEKLSTGRSARIGNILSL